MYWSWMMTLCWIPMLLRTYTLLSLRKPEYADVFVGGAMLRLDRP